MYRRIAVPLDVTKESRTALHWAVTIARLAGCPLDLVTVAFPPIYGSELYGASIVGAAEIDEMLRDADERLRDVAHQVEALGMRVHATVLQGTVPTTLSEHVHSTGADLVVMTTHDRGRLESLLLGSVSHSVIRHVNVPVLLLHEGQGEPPPITTLATVSHVLVPFDGSPFGAQILPHAATFAELMHADVTLLGVLQPMLAVAAVSPGLGTPPDVPQPQLAAIDAGSEEERVELQREPLERTAESLRARKLSVHVRVLVDGQPAHAIVDYARRHGTDLIAMTTHGHGALKRLVAGSVSEAVLRAAPTPMLMYRPEGPG